MFKWMQLGERMKKTRMRFFQVGLLFLLIVTYVGCNNQNQNSSDTSIDIQAALSVDDAVRNLKPDTTVCTVIGVVQTVTPNNDLLTLIDVEEYKICGLSDCCLYMPVRWQGEMPKIEDIVTVQGTIEATGSDMVFTANKLQVDRDTTTQ
jgi:hypothetical protein